MAAKTAETKELAVQKEAGLPAPADFMDSMESLSGVGAENIEQRDIAVPFIKCAQALSPEANRRDAAYIPGLEQGDFFNSATQQVWKGEDGFQFVPVLYKCTYLEWVPRDSGGGLAGEHGADILAKCTRSEKGAYFLPNGNEVIETAVWYGLVLLEDGEFEQAVISLAKTQFKKSKTLVSKLLNIRVQSTKGPNKYNPPFMYNVVHVKSVPESNDQGNWMGWSFTLDGTTGTLENARDVISYAVNMHRMLSSGELKADMSKTASESSAAAPEHTGPAFDAGLDGDIPF